MNRIENHEKDHFNFISLRYGCVFFVCLFLGTVGQSVAGSKRRIIHAQPAPRLREPEIRHFYVPVCLQLIQRLEQLLLVDPQDQHTEALHP